ncbi:phospholipase D1 [Pelomyxa schiedti]|nr:phospholipase D1 [Pelomyxa schiedti]
MGAQPSMIGSIGAPSVPPEVVSVAPSASGDVTAPRHEMPSFIQDVSDKAVAGMAKDPPRSLAITLWNDTDVDLELIPPAKLLSGDFWNGMSPPLKVKAQGVEVFATRGTKLLIRCTAASGSAQYRLAFGNSRPILTVEWELLAGSGGFGLKVTAESPDSYKAAVFPQTGHTEHHYRCTIRFHAVSGVLTQGTSDKLVTKTHFRAQELAILHDQFIKACCPYTEMTEGKFVQLFPELNNPVVVHSIFKVFDSTVTSDNQISFEEFASVLSIMAHGSAQEKAELAYNMCDLNKDGTVERQEVLQVALQLSSVMIQLGFSTDTYGQAELCVQNVFRKFTVGRDFAPGHATTPVNKPTTPDAEDAFKDSLTKEEFVTRAMNEDADFLTCFGLFDYFKEKIVTPIEKTLATGSPVMEYGGWMLKTNPFLNVLTNTQQRRYFYLRGPFLGYGKTETDAPINVVHIGGSQVRPATNNIMHLETHNWARAFSVPSEEERDMWLSCLRKCGSASNRFKSYAPERLCNARWFVCGKEYFTALEPILNRAVSRIMICDWCLSPEVYLKRDSPLDDDTRLDRILLKKAIQGVEIYVMIWNCPPVGGFDLQSAEVVQSLRALHNNIRAIAHPFLLPIMWSHHQKLVVVDDQVAFVGGIDLCYGRYEEPWSYPIVEPTPKSFPAHDYTNCNTVGETNGPWTREVLNRATQARLPWHDIHVQIDGQAAEDIVANFIQRWNHAIATAPTLKVAIPPDYPYLMPMAFDSPRLPLLLESEQGFTKCYGQALRSIANWSCGAPFTEQSIYKAYLSLIRNAKHYIYIENQYFISSLNGQEPENMLLKELLQRLRKAITNSEDFVCVVLLPVYPAGDIKALSTRFITKAVQCTICCGPTSLIGMLKKEFPSADIQKYVAFYALRNHGILGGNPITEGIYVHTKAIIVDDRKVLVGSANINDRSLCGNRDSEIAVLIEENSDTLIESVMAGRPCKVSPFAHSLRVRLWRELAGLGEGGDAIRDPIACASLIREIARRNTEIYLDVFKILPNNAGTLAELLKAPTATMADYHKIWGVQGFITEYPYKFLQNENVTFSIGDAEYLLPRSVFF